MTKANSYIKLHKKGGNILGIKGFFSRIGETKRTLKEGWSFLSVGLEVSRSMQDFEKRQERGEVDEDEIKQMETDMSGKMLLVAWKGSKFELSAVLRQVVDGGKFSGTWQILARLERGLTFVVRAQFSPEIRQRSLLKC